MVNVEHRAPYQPLVPVSGIEHHVTDLTATVSADMTLAQFQAKLAEQNQWLPIDGDPSKTLRDLIESNSSGPLRLGYGAWRDLMLGAQFTTKSGRLITAGGRTMKNVAGYDLTKFMIGQFGLFGSLLTITTRTYRRPTHALLARFQPSDALIGELLPTTSRPTWAMLSGDSIHCGYLGDEQAIAFYENDLSKRQANEIRRVSVEEENDFRAQRWLPTRPDTRFRASVPPAKLNAFVQSQNLSNFAADPAFGTIVGSIDPSHQSDFRQAVTKNSGSVVFDDPADRATYFGASEIQRKLLERLQKAFDE